MDIGSLLLALALVIAVAAFVARPLLQRNSARPFAAASDDLVAQREAVLIELRDLDFDHATGKIGDDDYAAQRARLTAKGVEIFRALDARRPAPAAGGDDIEKAIAARRRGESRPRPKAARPVVSRAGDDIEKAVAARRRKAEPPTRPDAALPRPNGHPAPALAACPNCAASVQPGDKFCPKCGARLTAPTEAA